MDPIQTMVSERKESKNVCVIGAGPSGIAVARELRREGHEVVVLEQNHDIGGQWLYDPNVEQEEDPLGRNPWLKKQEKKSDEEVEQVFDAVVVATGHYSSPRLPCIQGMDKWRRRQMHSHIYRSPEPFRGEIVVVVGNSFSGQEISLELVKVVKELHLSSKSLDIYEGLSKVVSKYENFHLRPQIDNLQEDGSVVFTDGSRIIADTVLYCTGYNYSFPFLDTKGIVVVDDNRVGPLYEHTFPPSLAPSLSLVGIPKRILGLPFFEYQGKWIAELLSGKKVLPSCEEMMKSIEEFYDSREAAGIHKRHTHEIGDFEYIEKYGELAGFRKLEEWRKELCVSSIINYFVNLETCRDSWYDDEKLREALQSPYFTQLVGVDLEDVSF
ncbi:hypothetical protein PHAVU_L001665 [Phaseolus vulgaris]|uniref:Uncharacterized protein n=1 Tax=Phaseolus vulgaris TaxID=3885 RepID=A0ACC3P068_PHAVU